MAKIIKSGWFWPILGGAVVGLLNLFHYFVSPKISIDAKPFAFNIGGSLATTLSWTERIVTGKSLFFQGIPAQFGFLIFGLLLGSFLEALISKKFSLFSSLKAEITRGEVVQAAIGGTLIGFGVLLANGCVIKHLLSGAPGLSLGSLGTVISIGLAVKLGSKIRPR